MLYGPENFNYLRQSQCYTVNGVDDAKEFADTRVIFSLSLSLSLFCTQYLHFSNRTL